MAPILDENTLEFVSRSPDQTQRLGARLGALLRGGEVVCLEGALGAGKTCLAQGIGRGWGVSQTLTSPTFVLIREYARPETAAKLYHIDLYRISGAAEVLTLGIEEMLGDSRAICVIEWAERSKEELKPIVLRKLNAAKGGGMIFQSDHSVPSNVSAENYEYVINLVREYGRYPLCLGEYDIPDLNG